MRNHKRPFSPRLACLALLVSAAPIRADHWTFSLRGGISESTSSASAVDEVSRREGEGGSGQVLTAAIERRFNDRIGFEFGVMFADAELEVTITPQAAGLTPLRSADDLGFAALTLALPIHFGPEKIGLVAGPRVAWAQVGDWTFDAGPGQVAVFDLDDEFGYGAFLGADIAVGAGRWRLSTRLDYLNLEVDGTSIRDPASDLVFDLDLFMASVGFGYRF